MARREPRIVAELGRAETPEETAARKAAASERHRANQTVFNLLLALAASLAVVLVASLVLTRPAPPETEGVDYAAVAAEAQGGSTDELLVPDLPDTWSANAARFRERAGVPTWYIGFITPSEQFIALNQGVDANVTWQSSVVQGVQQTGTTTIDGHRWSVFNNRDADDPGNVAFALATTIDGSTIVLHGTAAVKEFEELASAIATELEHE